jgi:hypothetical protein
LTHATGAPDSDTLNIQTAGPRGPALQQDVGPIEKMDRRHFLGQTTIAAGALAWAGQASAPASAQPRPGVATFRRPKKIIPVPTPALKFQRVEKGVPDTQLTREATGLLHEFSTTLLFNHSHRAFFWANEMGRQSGQKFDAEMLFVCAAFHDLGLLKRFSSADDRFEVDSANAMRQFLEHHSVPNGRIQTAWDAVALHTTPGIAAFKPLEVELLYNGVALDVLGVGYHEFPKSVREPVVARFPRVNFKQDIAKAFFDGFGHKPQTAEFTCNDDICSHFIRGYQRANFYDTIQKSPFENS